MKRTPISSPLLPGLALVLGAGLLTACGDDGGDGNGSGNDEGSGGDTVTVVTHDSFLVSDDVLARFTEETGHTVEILRGGDAGVMVNQAVLSAGNPQADVIFGLDNTLLSRALDAGILTPHTADGLDAVPEEYQLDADEHRVTPVDTGDICVNYDRAWFADAGLAPPETFEDLADPAYRDLLVVQNAATSSPGLGFLLGTVAAFGEDGWADYWERLADNGVEVVDGWEQAYNERFSGAGNGDRPLVVSYASSPPAGVVYGGDERPDEAPTGVATGTCFRQVEFAGLLDGAANPEGGRAFLDFLLTRDFQEDMPLQMFVNPVVEGAEVPEEFTRYGATVEDPLTMAPDDITAGRERWIEEWTSLVVR
ncbi:thiamine ABC transporter substrate binding subunit [Streptomyces radicis]|uniref:Thiamine ABC transporter substrate-binding protein n=1 Tax=Streptomyces radicis TaxID=1750517 RepID=A0A3A9W0B5_9ACTN|nr:thiamine ABC transporter substrate-binding protein [Streptomyces radicis]RKN06675.1 thiamine ABC transporter substrate-binding protein [Streptomyces radicis]RKN19300.1 thiamine ABC transporter substrate-binding protein [Streptomyces radicis]